MYYLVRGIGSDIYVRWLLLHMSIYEAMYLETKPYKPPYKPNIFLVNPSQKSLQKPRAERLYFDWENDGFAESSSWVAAGDNVLLYKGSTLKPPFLYGDVHQGWGVLDDLDGNHDGRIDARDKAYHELAVWSVRNPLAPQAKDLAPFSIRFAAIDLKKHTIKEQSGYKATYPLVQLGIKTVKVNTKYKTSLEDLSNVLEIRNKGYPNLLEHGYIPSLEVVAAKDTVLRNQLKELEESKLTDIFAYPDKTNSKIENILFRWAGVENIKPESRGPYIDARKLAVLEKLVGEDFFQIQKWSNPRPYAAKALNKAWDLLFKNYKLRLIFQTCGRILFDPKASYNVENESADLAGGINKSEVADLLKSGEALPANEQEALKKELGEFLKSSLVYLPIRMEISI